ncbi:MAG: hypothetical protein JXQ83_08800 [Candidatus Glassbacteria bacterium]|nr:hypothetical protein [Candidatus Glassbacteria bacterium]
MKAKHIIVAVLALAGIIAGGYNWLSYFKATSPGSAITAVRPQPPQETPGEAALPGQTAALASRQQPDSAQTEPPREKIQWPDTVGRNPFLTPGEIEIIARGEWVEEQPEAPVMQPGVAMPELKITGLILDRTTGSYQALINGKAYHSGDQVGLETIVEINAQAVILEYGGHKRTVSLNSDKDKDKSSTGVTLKKAP